MLDRLALLFRCDNCNQLERKLDGNYLAVTEGPPGERKTLLYCNFCAFKKYGDKTKIEELGQKILEQEYGHLLTQKGGTSDEETTSDPASASGDSHSDVDQTALRPGSDPSAQSAPPVVVAPHPAGDGGKC